MAHFKTREDKHPGRLIPIDPHVFGIEEFTGDLIHLRSSITPLFGHSTTPSQEAFICHWDVFLEWAFEVLNIAFLQGVMVVNLDVVVQIFHCVQLFRFSMEKLRLQALPMAHMQMRWG